MKYCKIMNRPHFSFMVVRSTVISMSVDLLPLRYSVITIINEYDTRKIFLTLHVVMNNAKYSSVKGQQIWTIRSWASKGYLLHLRIDVLATWMSKDGVVPHPTCGSDFLRQWPFGQSSLWALHESVIFQMTVVYYVQICSTYMHLVRWTNTNSSFNPTRCQRPMGTPIPFAGHRSTF